MSTQGSCSAGSHILFTIMKGMHVTWPCSFDEANRKQASAGSFLADALQFLQASLFGSDAFFSVCVAPMTIPFQPPDCST